MKKLLGILVLGSLWCNFAAADMTVKLYKQYKNSSNKMIRDGGDNYINGVGKGIFWTNIMLQVEIGKDKGLYCQPDKLALHAENYMDFLDREIKFQKKENRLSDDDNIELLLIMHLMRIFPCK